MKEEEVFRTSFIIVERKKKSAAGETSSNIFLSSNWVYDLDFMLIENVVKIEFRSGCH